MFLHYSLYYLQQVMGPIVTWVNQLTSAQYNHNHLRHYQTDTMSGIPSLTILSKEQKFNGDNLLQWNTNITQLLGFKGLLGYVNRKTLKPGPSDCQGFWVGSVRVRVRVGISVPLKNPYPWQGSRVL